MAAGVRPLPAWLMRVQIAVFDHNVKGAMRIDGAKDGGQTEREAN